MANVFEFAPAQTTRLRRSVHVLALNGLDARLLVDGQDHHALGRLPIKRTDVVDLFAELRIRAMQPLPHTMGTNIARLQNAVQLWPSAC